jgi:hypothetical protein
LAFTRYDIASKKLLASNARGGDATVQCGTAGMWTWPSSLKDVFTVFSDRTLVSAKVMGVDGDGRQTVWAIASGYQGVMLHELQHAWRLPHSRDPYDVISTSGFKVLSRFFTFVEPPSKKNPQPLVPSEHESACIAPISASALKYSRWFALDDKPWKDGGAPRITPAEKEGDILIESEHGLAYIGIDVRGEAIAYKSWGQDGREPPHSYVLTAGELKELAGTTNVRIRAVDIEDQQTDAETKNLGYDTTVYPSTSEAVEIQVPHGQKLVLDVHFHFPKAEPEGDLGVYLSKTRERVFVANAAGEPNQHWESPVNGSDRPITYSIVGYYKIRSKVEEPWRVASKVVTTGPKVTEVAFQGRRATGPGGGNGSYYLLEPVDVSTAHVELK